MLIAELKLQTDTGYDAAVENKKITAPDALLRSLAPGAEIQLAVRTAKGRAKEGDCEIVASYGKGPDSTLQLP